MDDKYNLQRFISAQNRVYDEVRTELREGCKIGHWMWFIFPQIEGLGSSETSRRFAISSSNEAEAYLKHPLLGPRLKECTRLVNSVKGRSARRIFGSPDDLKFRSCMTLFASVAVDDKIFDKALMQYFDGKPDRLTLAKLRLSKTEDH
jgi:uncharacterized protein (DUF1810 family)